jgi:transposase
MDEKDEKEIRKLIKLHKEAKKNNIGLAYKINALILLYKNYTYQQIEDALLIDERTIRRYRDIYVASDIVGLMKDNYKGGFSKLSEAQQKELERDIESEIFPTAGSVCVHVKKKYGKEYTPEGMVKLLHRMGFSYKKTKAVPGKADRKKQEEFLRKYKQIRKSLKMTEKIYFMDGVHPTHNVQPAYCWIRTGKEKEVRSNTGRERVNINGVYSPIDKEIIVREDDRINSESTIALLKEIEARHPELTKIIIIRDNARYYCSQPVNDYLKKSNIEFLPLPSYSPNLNLIERLWKFFKKEVIANKYYETYSEFKYAVMKFFEIDVGNYNSVLDSLLAENFHLVAST